jgi:hypothetical protein
MAPGATSARRLRGRLRVGANAIGLGLLAALLAALLGHSSAAAQAANESVQAEREAAAAIERELLRDLDAVVLSARQTWLLPVLEDLRRRAGHDTKLHALLQRLDIRAIPLPRPLWGPNAVATYHEASGQPIVEIDAVFLLGLSRLADLGALALAAMPEVSDVVRAAGFQYGLEAARARREGKAARAFEFRLRDAVLSPVLRSAAERLSAEVFAAGVCWVVLHEVAHHMLHLGRPPPATPQAARAQELQADAWAFQVMEEIGYGLGGADAALSALEVGEAMQSMAAGGADAGESGHPRWQERRQALLARHDTRRPPSGRQLGLLYFTGGEGQPVERSEIWVPVGDPDRDGDLYALVFDPTRRVQRLPFEWTGDALHLYGRDKQALSELVIHDARRAYHPQLGFINTTLADGHVTRSASAGIRLSTAPLAHGTVGPVAAQEALNMAPRAVMTRVLASIPGLGAARQAAALQEWTTLVTAARRALIGYARGQLSLAAASAQIDAAQERGRARLAEVLGREGLARYDRALSAEPMLQLRPAQP